MRASGLRWLVDPHVPIHTGIARPSLDARRIARAYGSTIRRVRAHRRLLQASIGSPLPQYCNSGGERMAVLPNHILLIVAPNSHGCVRAFFPIRTLGVQSTQKQAS